MHPSRIEALRSAVQSQTGVGPVAAPADGAFEAAEPPARPVPQSTLGMGAIGAPTRRAGRAQARTTTTGSQVDLFGN